MRKSLGQVSPKREAEIAMLAEQIAETRFKGRRVDPELIAAQEGIPFRYAPFPEEFDGILAHDAGHFFVICNERRAARGSPRSRFTFAHELGHYFLADHREALASGRIPPHLCLADFTSNRPIERESDLFAAHLLMPMSMVYDQWSAFGAGLELINGLAGFLGTSVTATAFRTLRLEVFSPPAAIFRWNALGALVARRMSPATFNLCKDVDDCRLADIFPEDSATAQAVQYFSVGRQARRADCVPWFPGLRCSAHAHDASLREEVMSLGQFGWITLVHREGS